MEIQSPRGIYRIGTAAAPEHTGNALVLTISLERADGIERFAFQCVIADELIAGRPSSDVPVAELAGWISDNFENIRESSLRSLRTMHRPWQAGFDAANPGPLKPSREG
jgi:hypothetical protein